VNQLVIIAVLFGVFWLLLIRPQRARARQQRELIQSVEPGDEIVSTGGLFGLVKRIEGDELVVEIAPGTEVRMARRAVAGVVEPEEPDEPDGPDEPEHDRETAEPG
jgi:preprotein translocase subunit YajC